MNKSQSISILVLSFIVLAMLPSRGVAQDAASLILEAKQVLEESQNANDMTGLMKSRTMFERATADEQHEALAYYYMGLADYRMASMKPEKKHQLKYINQGIDALEKAIKIDENMTEGYALLGSIMGWKSGLKPMQAMFLGPKSTNMVAKAKEMEPDNPRVTMIAAISDYNTPKMFGGDPERAKEGFKKAATLFEREEVADPLMPAWGHEETYAWLGQALVADGAIEEARAAYEKALEINPEYGWVKFMLLPKLPSAAQ